MRGLVAAAAGLTLCIAAGGAHASDDEGVAKAKAAADAVESEFLRLSVLSYIQDWRGRNVALPVLVTMQEPMNLAVTEIGATGDRDEGRQTTRGFRIRPAEDNGSLRRQKGIAAYPGAGSV